MADEESKELRIQQLKDDLSKRLNAVVDDLAKAKGVSREEILRFAKDFLSSK